ncbi:MAG: FecR domain-containing protein [Cyclobacteriaceae bacterium]
MNNKNYTVDELLLDDSFISYVLENKDSDTSKWETLLSDKPQLESNFVEAAEIIKSLKYQDLSFSESENAKIWNRIEIRTEISASQQKNKTLPMWLKVAAALIPIIVSSIWVLGYFQETKVSQEISSSMVVKDCLNGRKMTVTLPDGSTVKMNSGTRISYNSRFEGDVRSVWLDGEAFFDVKRNPEKPFIIISGNIRTQVLGTSFNVKSYEEEGVVDVVVASGLVSVSRFDHNKPDKLQWDNISGVVLNPDELVSYDVENDKFSSIVQVSTDEYLAWKSGILVFKRAPFVEIVSRLERWYGVEFEMEDSIEIPDGFTGRFDNKSLRRVLEGISYTSKFDFEIEGKKVKISKVKIE